jgi:uncharacterized protein (DUF305 family)
MRFSLGTGRTRIVSIALIVVVLLGVGYGAGLLTPRLRAPSDDSAEAGFARDMSVHHAQAVRMSILEYANGENDTVRRLAYDMATSQEYQMGVMETWLQQWSLALTTDRSPMEWVPNYRSMLQSDGRMPGLASTEDMTKLEKVKGKDADILFCQLMIRHHLGGIHMIDAVLAASDVSEVRTLATSMRNGQQAEVDVLNLLLKGMGAQPL